MERLLIEKAKECAPYFLTLLRNRRVWVRRRVTRVEFRDSETVHIKVSLDIDLKAAGGCRDCEEYLNRAVTKGWQYLPVPLLLRQRRLASFHALDYEGNHLSLLNTDESKHFRTAINDEIKNESGRTDVPDAVKAGNEEVRQLLNENGRLAIVQVSLDYLERHPLHYSYWAPLGLRDLGKPGSSLKRGYPELIRLDLLHAQSAASYHFEIEAPPGTVIYDRRLDVRPPMSHEMVVRGGFAPPNGYPDSLKPTIEDWPARDHATLYLLNSTSENVEKLPSVWINLWVGVERSAVLAPAVTNGIVAVVLIAAATIMGLFPGTLAQVPQQAAAASAGLGTAIFAYWSVPGKHEVSNWLYRGIRRAVVIAGALALAGFIGALASISDTSRPITVPALGVVALLNSVPLTMFVIVYRRGGMGKALKEIEKRHKRGVEYLTEAALASRTVG